MIGHLHGGNYGGFYNSASPLMQGLVRATLLRLDRLIVLSQCLREGFRFEPRLNDRIRIVPNGLPAVRFTLPCAKELPKAPGEPIRILYLSNLVESKGYLDVLESVALLANCHGINAFCDFAGSFRCSSDDRHTDNIARAESLFRETISRLAIQDRVCFHGPVSGAAKIRLFENAHVFVLPTNYCNEGQPISIIEAMASGNAVVSTNFRAIPDMVKHGHNGCLVQHHNPAEIANAIAWMVAEPQRYSRMSEASISLCRNEFSYNTHVVRMINILLDKSDSEAESQSPHD
jgi:glycosyltransferase involved in cell wall biosynthesis